MLFLNIYLFSCYSIIVKESGNTKTLTVTSVDISKVSYDMRKENKAKKYCIILLLAVSVILCFQVQHDY